MKYHLGLMLLLFITSCASPRPSGNEHDFSDLTLLAKVQNRSEQLSKLTHNPIPLPHLYSLLCGIPDGIEKDPHKDSFIHVYMDLEASNSGHAPYPIGTFVIKEKLPDMWSNQPELFTGMLKREKGYNPEAGDWEFMVIDGRARSITARGKISSCLDCHSRHQKTDYLTEVWKKSPTQLK